MLFIMKWSVMLLRHFVDVSINFCILEVNLFCNYSGIVTY